MADVEIDGVWFAFERAMIDPASLFEVDVDEGTQAVWDN